MTSTTTHAVWPLGPDMVSFLGFEGPGFTCILSEGCGRGWGVFWVSHSLFLVQKCPGLRCFALSNHS